MENVNIRTAMEEAYKLGLVDGHPMSVKVPHMFVGCGCSSCKFDKIFTSITAKLETVTA